MCFRASCPPTTLYCFFLFPGFCPHDDVRLSSTDELDNFGNPEKKYKITIGLGVSVLLATMAMFCLFHCYVCKRQTPETVYLQNVWHIHTYIHI